MNQAITVSPKTIGAIVQQLAKLTKEVKAIKTKLFSGEPPYGSDAWWELSDKKAIEEIKAGKGIKFDTVQDAIKWFHS